MTQTSPSEVDVSFKNPYLTVWIEGGIMCARYTDDLHLTLEIAKQCVEARIYHSKGESYPLWIDMRGIKSTTKDARRYMATMGTTLVKAAALITGSIINRTLGNIFVSIDKPPVPVKLFTSESKAKQWLQQYV